ncbi:MAG: asparagine synthase (glutamine-hydrolyzing) [Candidatus Zambryskibacteria bacterium]|nr:asparagine synthase (glutamine-hydrolyzing) [Candidatus Zambryskibacteria bacterium]
MCGITGITGSRIGDKEKAVRLMNECITHRGPDDDGFYTDEYVALGMRRLSIIDLAHGKQPISSADGRYLIFFNGEIYNYRELKRELEGQGQSFKTESDTEVILRMYELEGEKMLTKLRGMFVFAIYDTQEKKVFIARDYFGIKPLYYFVIEGKIAAFSSEIKSFLKLKEFKPEVNDAAVYNYLSYQYNPLKETFFKNVFKLSPGHYLKIDLRSGQFEEKSYWQFKFEPVENLDEGKTREKILLTMEDSVAHHMIADVPVGSFLSGGIDSSIIATLMQKIRGEKKIKTFTVGFESLSEGVEAKETSGPLGTDHTEITISSKEYFEALPKAVWHFDEPVADPSAIGLYFLAREARKHVTVVLSGEGSDELFGGYNIYLEPFARARIAWLPRPVLKFLSALPLRGSNFAMRALQNLEERYIGNASIFKTDEVKKLWKGPEMSRLNLDNLYAKAEGLSDSTKMQYVDINTWLVGDILAKADKMTMAHSLELRVPFLDKEVAELASMLPDKFKWRGGVTKYLLREAFKSVLPESTRNRKKLGFPTPVKTWFNRDREDIYEIILDNEYIKSRLDTAVIRQLIEDHVSRKRDNSRKIYLLLMLALWYNTFIGTKSA